MVPWELSGICGDDIRSIIAMTPEPAESDLPPGNPALIDTQVTGNSGRIIGGDVGRLNFVLLCRCAPIAMGTASSGLSRMHEPQTPKASETDLDDMRHIPQVVIIPWSRGDVFFCQKELVYSILLGIHIKVKTRSVYHFELISGPINGKVTIAFQ